MCGARDVRDRVRRCLPLSELARGLEPLTCCFSAGRVEALWQGVVVWRLALSDAAWTPIVFDHPAVAEPKVWGTSVGVSGVRIVYAAVMFRHAINCLVSAKIRPRMAAALSVLSVRLSTCLIGPGRTDW